MGSVYQSLDHTLSADTVLDLSVDIGWRFDQLVKPSYMVQLWAGNNLLASEFSTTLVQGDFVTSLLSYNVTASNPYIGEQIKILLSETGGRQVNFDNVLFSNADLAAVPEPATMFLLGSGLLGLGRFLRKKKG